MTTAVDIHTDELEHHGVSDVSKLPPVRTIVKQADVPKGWAIEQGHNFEGEVTTQWLVTRKQFNDFIEAWAFASKVALLSEKRKHHPDMTIGWNYVDLRLTTHAAGQRLTPADFKLAEDINKTSEMKEKLRVLFENESHLAQVEKVLGHPVPGYEPPPMFIPIGEETGRISMIGGSN